MSRWFPLLALAACHRHDSDSGPGDTASSDPMPVRSCEVVVSTRLPDGVTSAQVAGAWSDFHPQDMVEQGDGTWTFALGEPQPGTYGFKFLWDGVWETVPADVLTTWNDGVENRALVVGDCDLPDLQAVSGSATADGTLDAVFAFTRAADGASLDELEVTVGDTVVQAVVTDVITVHATGLGPGKHTVHVHATDSEGRPPESGDAALPLWVEDEPFVWQSGPMYYVFLDRFADGGPDGLPVITGASDPGTNYLGGDLVGAREKLDAGWFDDLGVKTIWLSPVYQNPDASYVGTGGYMYTGYHGYWPIRATEVEDRLGTTEVPAADALREFIDDAHGHGIRVILDTVLNHVHEDHEYTTEHPEWFTADACVCTTDAGACNWDTNPIGCWFTPYLPDLDYKDQAIVDRVVHDTTWWVDHYDVDGFRVDAAKHMDHVILRTLSMRLRDRYEAAGGAPFYLVGETFTGQGGQGLIMNYVAPYELDGQFDFPLLFAVRGAVGHGGGFSGLAAEVRGCDATYGEAVHGMAPFLGNHDVTRFTTDVEGCDTGALFGGCADTLGNGASDAISDPEWNLVNRLSMAYAFVATQPGVPMLYYGDELGLAGETDPDNRRLMPWGDLSMSRRTVLQRFQELGTVRNAVPALQTGDRRELWVDDSLYVYARDNGGGDVAIVALSTAERSQDVPIPTALSLEGVTLGNALADTREWTVSGGNARVELHPWEYVVMVPR